MIFLNDKEIFFIDVVEFWVIGECKFFLVDGVCCLFFRDLFVVGVDRGFMFIYDLFWLILVLLIMNKGCLILDCCNFGLFVFRFGFNNFNLCSVILVVFCFVCFLLLNLFLLVKVFLKIIIFVEKIGLNFCIFFV